MMYLIIDVFSVNLKLMNYFPPAKQMFMSNLCMKMFCAVRLDKLNVMFAFIINTILAHCSFLTVSCWC